MSNTHYGPGRPHDPALSDGSPLRKFLWERLERIAFTVRDFSAELGLSSHSYVHKVMCGREPFPIKLFDRWADALKLQGSAREEFLDIVMRECLPEAMTARLEADARRIQELKVRVAHLERSIVELSGLR